MPMRFVIKMLKKSPVSPTLWLFGLFVFLLFLGHILPPYYLFLLSEILIWGLFAMSFDILFGYTGLLSFGQSMYFGIGAYSVTLSLVRLNIGVIEALIIAVSVSILVGLMAGCLALRLRGHQFVIITVIFSLVVFFLATHAQWLTGGDDGISVDIPKLNILKVSLSFYDLSTTYYFVLAVVSITFMFCWRLVHSPIGQVFVAIKENEQRARFLGYNVFRYKLASYATSAALGGLAGGLYTVFLRYSSTNFLYWTVSGDAAIWTIFGGKGTLFGPFIGTLLFVTIKDQLSSMFAIYPILVGLILIVLILKAPAGVIGIMKKILSSSLEPAFKKENIISLPTNHLDRLTEIRENVEQNKEGPILEVIKLTKKFGGLYAVDDVSFKIIRGHPQVILQSRTSASMIGANAAGKTTIINLITGFEEPDSGEIRFEGRIIFRKGLSGEEVRPLYPEKILLAGIARTFQMSNIFPNMTVRENVWIAAQSRRCCVPHVRLAMRKPESLKDISKKVDDILQRVGLEGEKSKLAGQLSYGRQKLLEIAITTATDPHLMLLDEPTAGASHEEVLDILRLIRQLSIVTGLIVIEHDLDIIRSLKYNTMLFDQGKKIAEGMPSELLERADVRRIFLGESVYAA